MPTLVKKPYDYTTDDPFSPFYDPEAAAKKENQPLYNTGGVTPGGTSFGKSPTNPSSTSFDYSGYSPYGTPAEKAPTNAPQAQYVQRRPIGSTTTSSSVMPDTPLPTMGTLPQYELPARDEGRVSALQQKHMYLRPQRRALDQALLSAGREENPAVRKYITGEALRGFSEGVSGEARRAGDQAEGLYGQERGEQIDQLKTNFATALQKLQSEYQAQLARYMAQIGKKQETKYRYQGDEEEVDARPGNTGAGIFSTMGRKFYGF